MNTTIAFGTETKVQRDDATEVRQGILGNPPRLVERGGLLVLQTYMGWSQRYEDDGRGMDPEDAADAWKDAADAHGEIVRTCLDDPAPPPRERAQFWDDGIG